MDMEFGKLKNNISLLSRDRQTVQSILVAGSIHDEGSSVVSRNLARAIAEGPGLKVLFIDFNFRSVKKPEKERSTKGLSDYFLEGLELESIIQNSDLPNLSLINAGRQKCDPTEIIYLKEFSQTLALFQKDYSYIIIDSTPLQYYPESTLLASKVDGVLLVVEMEGTKREVVIDTKKKLDAVQANILGVILNKKKNYIPKLIYSFL